MEDIKKGIRIPCLWVSVGKEPGEARVALGSTVCHRMPGWMTQAKGKVA